MDESAESVGKHSTTSCVHHSPSDRWVLLPHFAVELPHFQLSVWLITYEPIKTNMNTLEP